MNKPYQVTKTEAADEGTRYVMSNGESVVVAADGSSKCFNMHGRGLANSGRFAEACWAMRRAVAKFQTVAA